VPAARRVEILRAGRRRATEDRQEHS
jgi:hypothetical protein